MRVSVVGAGIVGLACAEELVRGGHNVRVFDPDPASGATHAAAGMIAPAGESWHGEGQLLRLGLASAALWPEYAARLTARSGRDVDFRAQGTLLVGRDADDLRDVTRTLDVLRANDILFQELDRTDLRVRAPMLARAAGGAFLPHDHCVDPRQVARALLELLGGRVVRQSVEMIDGSPALPGGTAIESDALVIATGARARRWIPWVRPVRGETIRVRSNMALPGVLRANVHGQPVYLVPRANGVMVIGATEEEHDTTPFASVGGVLRLLGAARTLLPELESADLLDVSARHRPGTPDNGPLIGPWTAGGSARQILAVGHYRGGVLLAPLTARIVRAYIEKAPVPSEALSFTPDRFADRRPRDTTVAGPA